MGSSTKENLLCNENMNQTFCSFLNGKFLRENTKENPFPKGNNSIAKLTVKGTGGRNVFYPHEAKKL